MPLQELRIEVVTLSHVEVGHNVLGFLSLEHVGVEGDFVEVLVVLSVLEVVHNRHLRRIVLQQNLNRYRRRQTARH